MPTPNPPSTSTPTAQPSRGKSEYMEASPLTATTAVELAEMSGGRVGWRLRLSNREIVPIVFDVSRMMGLKWDLRSTPLATSTKGRA
ncbi:hypothetical protein V6N13_051285 [Hibiscus sabdariffa]